MATTVVDVTEVLAPGQKAVLLFWAPWHDDSAAGGTMDGVLHALAGSLGSSNMLFGRVEAEACPAATKHYKVRAVPTFVLLDASGAIVETIQGHDDVSKVTLAVQRLAAATSTTAAPSAAPASSTSTTNDDEAALAKRLDGLIRSSPVMLFMKGTPEAPKCGFSRQAVALLQDDEIAFGSFDILSDDQVRQGLKKHSNWPTYPQLYVNGTLIGGLDIMKEMAEEGSLAAQLGVDAETAAAADKSSEPAVPTLEERLAKLVRRHKIMLFMKGLPSAPRCGFSRQLVDILNGLGVSFDAFNILEDEEVRQGLKTFSNWPTYPQLYVNGNLIGGLDIVKEMQEDGSLKEALEVIGNV